MGLYTEKMKEEQKAKSDAFLKKLSAAEHPSAKVPDAETKRCIGCWGKKWRVDPITGICGLCSRCNGAGFLCLRNPSTGQKE